MISVDLDKSDVMNIAYFNLSVAKGDEINYLNNININNDNDIKKLDNDLICNDNENNLLKEQDNLKKSSSHNKINAKNISNEDLINSAMKKHFERKRLLINCIHGHSRSASVII